MGIGSFRGIDEALSDFVTTAKTARWFRHEDIAKPEDADVVGYTTGVNGSWLIAVVTRLLRRDGGATYDGAATNKCGLVVRLPPSVAETVFQIASSSVS